MGFGFEKEKEKVDYSNYLNKYVRISTGNSSNYVGKMASIDNNYAILNPVLVDLSCFDFTKYKISKENTMINTPSITAVESIPKRYLEDIVKQAKLKNKRNKSKK